MLYPPAPPGIPPDLTAPPRAYRLRVVVVLLCLLFFLLVYLGLLAATGYAAYWAVTSPFKERGPVALLLSFAVVLLAGLLGLFLLKGLFRRFPVEEAGTVEITEAEQPELFAFLRRLCAETQAPFPARVLVTAEVNAAVCYDRSVLGLVWPVRKNLVLGLGLVNVLNLTEFKAVLAHEFGHFSQKSMKLGSYVYVANQVLADLAHGRDWFDRLLDQLEHPVYRITLLVTLLRGLVWCVRKLLAGLFHVTNAWHAELSRQMEFNADLVAVSVTGSDAIVHALARLDFADEALDQAWHDLHGASLRRLYSRDLFAHQTQAVAYLRRLRRDPHWGEPPPLPDDPAAVTTVFHPDDDVVPAMWATHPPNPEREHNAKRRYCRGTPDERPAWLLFQEPQRLRERVTRSYYRANRLLPAGAELTDPDEVRRHVEEERAETTFDPRYHGLYDDRWLEPGAMTALLVLTTSETWEVERVRAALGRLWGDDDKALADQYHERLRERDALAEVVRGERVPRSGLVEFRGQRRPVAEAETLLGQVDEELADDRRRLAAFDRQVFQTHAQAASHLGGHAAQELLERYDFHLKMQDIVKGVDAEQARLDEIDLFLQENPRMDEYEYEHLVRQLQESHEALRGHLGKADGLPVPALTHVLEGTPLRGLLLSRPLLAEPGLSMAADWFAQFREQVADVRDRGWRVHVKSLSGILALHERIRREWGERFGRIAQVI